MHGPFIFHHIPKAGGTSIRVALSKWFKILNDYRPYCTADSEEYKRYLSSSYDLSKYDGQYLIVGHFEWDGIHIFERYPSFVDDNTSRAFAFFRNPLSLAISLYYHGKNVVGYNNNYTLEKHLSTISNFTAGVLGANQYDFKSIMDKYFYIGIVDDIQLSLDILASMLKKPLQQLPQLNISEKDKQKDTISLKTLDLFVQNNQLDISIFEYAKIKFAEYTNRVSDLR